MLQAIDDAHVVMGVLDARKTFAEQDATPFWLVAERGRACRAFLLGFEHAVAAALALLEGLGAAQTAEDGALGRPYRVLDGGFVTRFSHERRQDRGGTMFGEFRIAAVELGVVAQGFLHRGRAVIRHQGPWGAAEGLQRPYMGAEPVSRTLRPRRFRVQLRAAGPDRHEQPRPLFSAGGAVGEVQRIAGVVAEQLIPRGVRERHRHGTTAPPGLELHAERRVFQPVRIPGQVLSHNCRRSPVR